MLRADKDRRTDVGHREELLRKGARQSDAAVAGRRAWVIAGVKCDTVLVDALHPGHRRIVVFFRPVHRTLVEHRKDSGWRVAAGLTARNGRDGYQRFAAIEVNELVGQADDKKLRPGIGPVAAGR